MSSPIPNSLSAFHYDPVPITEFDDSDLIGGSNVTVPSLNSKSHQNKGQHVPVIRQSVLIGSLLEQLCSLYEADKVKSQKLYIILCDQLSKLGVISPIAYLKEFTSVHTQYKQILYNIIQSSVMRLHAKPSTQPNEHWNFSAALPSGGQGTKLNPVIVDPEKVFHFDTSRYNQEFTEKGRIGKGGYGSVFRAESKIDGQDYAIKKIHLRNSVLSNQDEILLREVRILAGLGHKNIVRYHAAWIEHVEDKWLDSPSSLHSDDDATSLDSGDRVPLLDGALSQLHSSGKYSFSGLKSGSFGLYPRKNGLVSGAAEVQNKLPSKFWADSSASEASESAVPEKSRKVCFSISPQNSDDEVDEVLLFQNSKSAQTGSGDSIQIQSESPPKEVILTHGVRRCMRDLNRVQSFIIKKHTPEFDEIMKTTRNNRSFSAIEGCQSNRKNDDIGFSAERSKSFPEDIFMKNKLVLYIQMELCQTSLKHWLSLRNKNIFQARESFCESTSLHIMKQIASALLFIHSKDLIHRDVKPPNIFLNGVDKPRVLLGDFGLAKNDFATSNLGPGYSTRAIPSGLHRIDSHTSGVGTTTYAAPEQLTEEAYDAKVDMYSFGIVIYELWTPFGTAMERAMHVKQLRKHSIPGEFVLKYPQLGKLVTSLLDHDPKMRPSAEEVFQGDFFEKSKEKIIEEQRERIGFLEDENKQLRLLNKKLKRLLHMKQHHA